MMPVGQPKKQRARMLKAECGVEGCGYIVRVAATHARTKGPPGCPVHGAMRVDLPPDNDELPETEGGQGEEVGEAV